MLADTEIRVFERQIFLIIIIACVVITCIGKFLKFNVNLLVFFHAVVKQLSFKRQGNLVDFQLGRLNHAGKLEPLDTLKVPNNSDTATSPKDMVYYAPRYNDYHKSNLFILAFNLEKIFPCIAGKDVYPTCGRFTAEEDGFNKGQNIVEAGDHGNDLKMFNGKRVYAFSVSGCPEVTEACIPKHYEISITCLLPGAFCSY